MVIIHALFVPVWQKKPIFVKYYTFKLVICAEKYVQVQGINKK